MEWVDFEHELNCIHCVGEWGSVEGVVDAHVTVWDRGHGLDCIHCVGEWGSVEGVVDAHVWSWDCGHGLDCIHCVVGGWVGLLVDAHAGVWDYRHVLRSPQVGALCGVVAAVHDTGLVH